MEFLVELALDAPGGPPPSIVVHDDLRAGAV